jgi:hypothetical protein
MRSPLPFRCLNVCVQQTAVSILSYNVWAHHFAGGPRTTKRLCALVQHIATLQPSVVLLQELFIFQLGPLIHASWFLLVAEGLAELGYTCVLDPREAAAAFCMNSGLAAFVKVQYGDTLPY